MLSRTQTEQQTMKASSMWMKSVFLWTLATLLLPAFTAGAVERPMTGHASWYGEEHRGKLMANGQKFDPGKMTAASWFYPLGTRVRVTLQDPSLAQGKKRTVIVTITDRGPSRDLVRSGRIIDLGQAAFEKLAPTDLGLIPIQVRPLR